MASGSATICVAPLSSPYCILPRAHTYTLVLALLIPLPQGWLFRAALAAFTTRTAIFAVDSIRLLATQRRDPSEPAHVDILIAEESLALAVIVAVWLLVVCRRGAESAARGLIRIWAVVVGIGAIVGFVALRDLARANTRGDCHGQLLSVTDVLGNTEEYGAGLGSMGDKIGHFVVRIGIVAVVFAAMAFLASLAPRHKSGQQPRLPVAAVGVYHLHDHDPWSSFRERGEHAMKAARLFLLVASPAMIIFVIVSAEWYLQRLAPGLPSAEKMASVGQWGVWAATGVVVIAAAVNAGMEKAGISMHLRPSNTTRGCREKDVISV